MARRPAHIPLNVFQNGIHVGTLRRARSGSIDFTYSLSWLERPHAIPVSLSLPLAEERYVGATVNNVFDNLLPDNEAILRRVAERVGAAGTDAYSLLGAIGHDCVGALQFLAEGVDPGMAGSTEGIPVSESEIAAILDNLARAPLGIDPDDDFRISLAGAQEKTALLQHDGLWLRPLGSAATTHILKPSIGRLPGGVDFSESVENEYLCLRLLQAFGLPVAKAEMATFGDRRTLVVERFDRHWTTEGRLLRRPQEDFCQALSIPPTRKYQSEGGPGIAEILGLLKSSDAPDADIRTFMKAVILYWLIGATDGHAKNFSVFLGTGGRFRLAPLYDVLSTQPHLDSRQIERKAWKMSMAVGDNRHYQVDEIMPRHFQQTAERSGIGRAFVRGLFEELADSQEHVLAAGVEVLPSGFPDALVASVIAGFRHRARQMGLT